MGTDCTDCTSSLPALATPRLDWTPPDLIFNLQPSPAPFTPFTTVPLCPLPIHITVLTITHHLTRHSAVSTLPPVSLSVSLAVLLLFIVYHATTTSLLLTWLTHSIAGLRSIGTVPDEIDDSLYWTLTGTLEKALLNPPMKVCTFSESFILSHGPVNSAAKYTNIALHASSHHVALRNHRHI